MWITQMVMIIFGNREPTRKIDKLCPKFVGFARDMVMILEGAVGVISSLVSTVGRQKIVDNFVATSVNVISCHFPVPVILFISNLRESRKECQES